MALCHDERDDAMDGAMRALFRRRRQEMHDNRSMGPGPNLDIEADFQYHPPTDEQVGQLGAINAAAKALASAILQHCPPSADRSVAYRLVREARMWANASIVIPRRP